MKVSMTSQNAHGVEIKFVWYLPQQNRRVIIRWLNSETQSEEQMLYTWPLEYQNSCYFTVNEQILVCYYIWQISRIAYFR